jgi:uncharacterized protein
MSLITAQRAVDFVLDITPEASDVSIGFTGGEPLLCFDLMKETIRYIRKREQRTGKSVALSVTSNGTLLTEPILDFFRAKGVMLSISIDGRANVHNLNRRYPDGRGTFSDVVRGLRLANGRLDNLQVNAVFGPDTVEYLLDSVSFFSQLGISAIHLDPDIRASYSKDIYPKLRTTYMRLADRYIRDYQEGRETGVNLIDNKIIVILQGGYGSTDKCGMGETEWGFAPSGNIYPCERLVGEDNGGPHCLGNVVAGLDMARRCSLLEKRGNHNEACESCGLQRYCMNWCGCINYHMTGHIDKVSQLLCESEKALIQAAGHVLTTLSESNNELFLDRFKKHAPEGAPAQTQRRQPVLETIA